MGLFDIFKKPTIVHDEFFGTLRLMDFKDASKNYFEGKGHFAPTGNTTEYLIEAERKGPTEEQRQFYRDLQAKFTQYIECMKPLIEDEFRNWKEDFTMKDFNREFELVGITIPRFDKQPLIWDMAFTTIHDLNHHVTIDFVGNHPNGILIDG